MSPNMSPDADTQQQRPLRGVCCVPVISDVRQQAMRTAFHWVVIAILVVVGLWGFIAFGQLFREKMPAFLCLWILTPVIALWLNTETVIGGISISSLKAARAFLIGAAIVLSFDSFTHFDRIRDALGTQFVDGYEVTYSEDTDEYSRPFRTSAVSTDHWYSRFELWVFEWVFLGSCLVIPYVVWRASTRAVERGLQRKSGHDEAA